MSLDELYAREEEESAKNRQKEEDHKTVHASTDPPAAPPQPDQPGPVHTGDAADDLRRVFAHAVSLFGHSFRSAVSDAPDGAHRLRSRKRLRDHTIAMDELMCHADSVSVHQALHWIRTRASDGTATHVEFCERWRVLRPVSLRLFPDASFSDDLLSVSYTLAQWQLRILYDLRVADILFGEARAAEARLFVVLCDLFIGTLGRCYFLQPLRDTFEWTSGPCAGRYYFHRSKAGSVRRHSRSVGGQCMTHATLYHLCIKPDRFPSGLLPSHLTDVQATALVYMDPLFHGMLRRVSVEASGSPLLIDHVGFICFASASNLFLIPDHVLLALGNFRPGAVVGNDVKRISLPLKTALYTRRSTTGQLMPLLNTADMIKRARNRAIEQKRAFDITTEGALDKAILTRAGRCVPFWEWDNAKSLIAHLLWRRERSTHAILCYTHTAAVSNAPAMVAVAASASVSTPVASHTPTPSMPSLVDTEHGPFDDTSFPRLCSNPPLSSRELEQEDDHGIMGWLCDFEEVDDGAFEQ